MLIRISNQWTSWKYLWRETELFLEKNIKQRGILVAQRSHACSKKSEARRSWKKPTAGIKLTWQLKKTGSDSFPRVIRRKHSLPDACFQLEIPGSEDPANSGLTFWPVGTVGEQTGIALNLCNLWCFCMQQQKTRRFTLWICGHCIIPGGSGKDRLLELQGLVLFFCINALAVRKKTNCGERKVRAWTGRWPLYNSVWCLWGELMRLSSCASTEPGKMSDEQLCVLFYSVLFS